MIRVNARRLLGTNKEAGQRRKGLAIGSPFPFSTSCLPACQNLLTRSTTSQLGGETALCCCCCCCMGRRFGLSFTRRRGSRSFVRRVIASVRAWT
jgi:hypothetical protein